MTEERKNKLLAHHDMGMNCIYEIKLLWRFNLFQVIIKKYYKSPFLKLRTYTGSRFTVNREKENKVHLKHRYFKPGFKKFLATL